MPKTKNGGFKWGTEDDAKLAQLFRMPYGGLDPTKLDIEDVKAAHQAHWSEMKYKTFSQRYRDKARDFCVSKTLNGHRACKFASLHITPDF